VVAKHFKEFLLAPLCFAFAFWLWASVGPPPRAQGFYAIQNTTSEGTSGASHAVLAVAQPSFFFGATCTGAVNETAATQAKYCVAIDSATIPADGTVLPKLCVPMTASGTNSAGGAIIQSGAGALPIPFQNGIVVYVSSGANCQTKTTSNTFDETVSVNYN
jgi:hypothetical protein